jgi:3-phenylpropionate/trans-cinnamate dioxygenase ferredoxin reductase component
MTSNETFVIVGASLAGAKAAETLRTEGFDGRVVLVGEEPVRPYERPPLSKGYLRGEQSFDDAAVHSDAFYAENDVDLRLSTTAIALDLEQQTVSLDPGDVVNYHRLLICTGSAPKRLPIPGANLDGVKVLRSVADSDALRAAFGPSTRVVVIGAGWIGSEVAASARQLGSETAMVDVVDVPLERVLGPEVGAVYRDLHQEQGVRLHLGTGIESIEGSGSVQAVRLSDGTVLPADVVVIGVGVSPRVDLAEAAGLTIDNGVVVDEHLETSRPGVYAAGDVANAWHPRYRARIRLEHWSAALNQGPAAARNMLGMATAYEKTPYFFSDQYDLGMEYRGWAPSWDQVVFRGDVSQREFISFWLKDGRVAAAMNANIWDSGDALDALVTAQVAVSAHELADPSVDLAGLSRTS